jgi:(S)-2-hydroxyglutarate dehydrogenase
VSLRHDFCIIGGGIVGLATAREILRRRPGASLVLLEKEPEVAAHQTGHNSGVIHAGVYYTPGSLKARLCRAGNRLTKQYCSDQGIPMEECGKVIVATTPLEVSRLADLRERCKANEITAESISATELKALEPHIAGQAGLLVPSTGIVDYRLVSRAMADEVRRQGGEIRLGVSASAITETSEEVRICLNDGESIRTQQLIACAGLQADRVAKAAGLEVDFRVVPFRGEYFRLRNEQSNLAQRLIYPVPDPELPFLGVHLTRMIGGYITVGPNAVLGLSRDGYAHFSFNLQDAAEILRYPGFWYLAKKHWRSGCSEILGSLSKRRYLQRCRRYCPELTLEDLQPYPAGIRAQVVLADGTLVHDFLFADTARQVHVLNAPSPAATAAMPIAELISERANVRG